MSIPLPALGIKPPEQVSPLDQMGKVLQLRNAQQQLQTGDLENQQRQMQLRDQQAMTAAMQQWDGKNPDELPGLIIKNKGSAQAVLGMKSKILEQKKLYSDMAKNDAETGEKNLEALGQRHDMLAGLARSLSALPDDQIGPAAQQSIQQATQQGLLKPEEAQQFAPLSQLPPDQLRTQLGFLEKHFQGDKAQREVAQQQATIAKDKAQADEATATAANKTAEANYYKTHGGAPGVPSEVVQMNDWLGKNLGKGPSDFLAWKAKQAPLATFNLQSGMLTDQAKDMAAENYFQTGQLPAGARSPAMISQIINRAGELHPGGNLSGNKAAFEANKGSLVSLQKNFDQVTAFENTAGKNLDVFLNTAKKVIDSGSPWINRPLRVVDAGALGDDDQAAFNAARVTAVTEIAKVLNSSNASGVLSDSARHEVEGLIGPNASLKQIVSAANVLKQDMANRHEAYQMQIGDIKKRLGPGVSEQPQQSAPTNTSSASGKSVSLAAAKKLPQNAGKSDAEIKADIEKYGHTVAP